MPIKPSLECLYCGLIRKLSREHIVPEALGGRELLPNSTGICSKCNNGVLSELDRELCNRSVLSVIASREISGSVWQTWDVDHREGGIFIEARPIWKDQQISSFVSYPQIVFRNNGPAYHADASEVSQFGNDRFSYTILQSLRRCFQGYLRKEKRRIHFESISIDLVNSKERYPPRAFFRRSVQELADNPPTSFVLRYCTPADKRLAIRELGKLGSDLQNKGQSRILPSSNTPRLAIDLDGGKVLRAVLKIGLNLLSHCCIETSLRHPEFKKWIGLVSGALPVRINHLKQCGFTRPYCVQNLFHTGKSHRFRIIYDSGIWKIYSSYFNGDAATYAAFRGPSFEDWVTMDLEMPLATGEIQVLTSTKLVLPMQTASIEWQDSGKICPSLQMQASDSKFVITKLPADADAVN